MVTEGKKAMPVFQVSSRIVQLTGPVKKRPTGVRRWRYFFLRLAVGGLIIAAVSTLLGLARLSFLFFLLLPVFVSILISRTYLYNRKVFLFRACLALLYFSAVTGLELLTHSPRTQEIIVVTTTLALAVLFEPARNYIQAFFEQRFHLRNDEAIRAVEAFISTLREEIDLDKVRDGLLNVVQQTMQPQAVSVWVRKTVQRDPESSQSASGLDESSEQVQHDAHTDTYTDAHTQEAQVLAGEKPTSAECVERAVAGDDPLLAYAPGHPGVVEVERLQLDSHVLQHLKANQVEIALPLVSQGELIGLLTLGSRLNGKEYAREDRILLNTLATQVAPALRVAQLVQAQQEQMRERERIEQELRTAQAIQQAFLPKDIPLVAGWQLVPYYQPAREVGGDFYDFFLLEDGWLGLAIGDVTGKGIPAALVMATVHTMLRSAVQGMIPPGQVLARVNDLLAAEIPAGMFVTCFYALLDPKSGRLRYANAGHEPPYRRHAGSATELSATGMPLGLMPGTRYDEYEAALAPGESLLFYSDGLVEAHNPRREMFGFPRLQTLLAEHSNGTPLIDFVLGELQSFTGQGWEQEDDVTLMMLQRTAQLLSMNDQPGEQDGLNLLLEWTVASVPGNEQQAMERVAEVVLPLHLRDERLADLKMAVAEAVMNAMEHGNAYQPDKVVAIQVLASQTSIVVRIRDQGEGHPIPETIATPDLDAKLAGLQTPYGWGLFLIKNLVDELHVTNDEHSHMLELIMRRE
jgi:serine phosphatase RsbU (regulator of sigma subunit)/anti-sigma regulatory factor (Ser/Thr protein kinase)